MIIGINEEIVNIVHNYVVRRLIAFEGIVYSGTISGPLDRIFTDPFDERKYVSIKEKAGAILYSIVHGHSFNDGNKRTGLLTTSLFLMYNGYVLHVPYDTTVFLEKMADALDPSAPTERDAIAWVKKYSTLSFFASLMNLILAGYCKLQGMGFITAITPIILEQNSIPYIDKEKLIDKTLRNRKKKQDRICAEP